jgi:hypothetical protein
MIPLVDVALHRIPPAQPVPPPVPPADAAVGPPILPAALPALNIFAPPADQIIVSTALLSLTTLARLADPVLLQQCPFSFRFLVVIVTHCGYAYVHFVRLPDGGACRPRLSVLGSCSAPLWLCRIFSITGFFV